MTPWADIAMQQPLAVALDSFSADIVAGKLPAGEWARAVRDCGAQALDIDLSLLLALDADAGTLLRQEMEKRGVVIAAVRADNACYDLCLGPSYFGAPRWVSLLWDALQRLHESALGAGLLVLTPPASDSMGKTNRIAANLARCSLLCAEWRMGLAISNEESQGYLGYIADVPRLGLALDLDLLSRDGQERITALEGALPHTSVARVLAAGDDEDKRVLEAWHALLAGARYDGFVSVRYKGTGDPYAGVGQALRLVRGPGTAPRGHPPTSFHRYC